MVEQIEGSYEVATSPELELLDSVCSYAATTLGTQGLRLLLEGVLRRQEAIGQIRLLSSNYAIASSPIGEIYVPASVCTEIEPVQGSSWVFNIMPSQQSKTQWRAVSATPNSEGWKSVAMSKRTAGRVRPHWREDAPKGNASPRAQYDAGKSAGGYKVRWGKECNPSRKGPS